MYALLVLVRLGLGVLFGFIISTTVVLQVFNPEVKREMSLMQTNAENTYLSGQRHSSAARLAGGAAQAGQPHSGTLRQLALKRHRWSWRSLPRMSRR